jgi:hypothetical protein
LLAVGAVAMLGWVFYAHMAERGGKKSASTPILQIPIAATTKGAQPSGSKTPIVPDSVVLPAPTAPPEPLPPLEPLPAPSASTKKRGRE